MAGPLEGVKVVEMAGVGPAPFCGMLLADMGADVVCIERPSTARDECDITSRGKRRVAIDLQESGGSEAAMSLIAGADMLVEGFRPGVMERLGLGPAPCQHENPRLVYGRMTGWGQTGPLSGAAGSDINYIALSGALHAMGRTGEPPPPPLNYVGDLGGGAMLLAVGLLAALHEAKATGRGQVVDAAMTDGAALLSSMFYGMKASGGWSSRRGENLLDGGAHFYDLCLRRWQVRVCRCGRAQVLRAPVRTLRPGRGLLLGPDGSRALAVDEAAICRPLSYPHAR